MSQFYYHLPTKARSKSPNPKLPRHRLYQILRHRRRPTKSVNQKQIIFQQLHFLAASPIPASRRIRRNKIIVQWERATNYNIFTLLFLFPFSVEATKFTYSMTSRRPLSWTHVPTFTVFMPAKGTKSRALGVGGKAGKRGLGRKSVWAQLRVINLNYCALCIWQRLKSTCSDLGQLRPAQFSENSEAVSHEHVLETCTRDQWYTRKTKNLLQKKFTLLFILLPYISKAIFSKRSILGSQRIRLEGPKMISSRPDT